MAYATLHDVEGLMPHLNLSGSSKPTETQVEGYLVRSAGEIDSALASVGLSVPVTEPPEFVEDLRQLNAEGAAGMALLAAYPNTGGPGSTDAGPTYLRGYRQRLTEFRKGIGIPSTSPQDAAGAPASYFTTMGAIGGGATDELGREIDAEPAIRREQVW